MRLEGNIPQIYRRSVEHAFETIIERGTDEQRRVMKLILESDMQVRVQPVSKINASGITGLIDPGETNDKISDGRIGLLEALGEVYIAIAEETIDTGGQRGCEGTFVHEGRHAYDFARTIESFSEADVNPLSVFDPTLYELELEAHRTSGEYMLRVGADEYLLEGLQLMILGRTEETGACFVDHEGIHCRLRDSYGLTPDGNQGPLASQLLGLKQR